jgi:hypothetical protein
VLTEHSFGGSRLDRYTTDFELGDGLDTGAAAPPLLGADPPTPAAAAPAAADPATMDPGALSQLLEGTRELTSIFSEIRDAQAPQAQLPAFGEPWGRDAPAGFQPPQMQPPFAPPGAPAPVAAAPVDPVAAAIAAYDPFRPESLGHVLQAQQTALLEGVRAMLGEELGPMKGTVEQMEVARGEQMARGYLDTLKPHVGPFDSDKALETASFLANQGADEGWALQEAAKRTAAYERSIGERYVQAYRAHVAGLAQAPGEPPAAPGAAVPANQVTPSGPGKYAAVVRSRLARERAAAVPATI